MDVAGVEWWGGIEAVIMARGFGERMRAILGDVIVSRSIRGERSSGTRRGRQMDGHIMIQVIQTEDPISLSSETISKRLSSTKENQSKRPNDTRENYSDGLIRNRKIISEKPGTPEKEFKLKQNLNLQLNLLRCQQHIWA